MTVQNAASVFRISTTSASSAALSIRDTRFQWHSGWVLKCSSVTKSGGCSSNESSSCLDSTWKNYTIPPGGKLLRSEFRKTLLQNTIKPVLAGHLQGMLYCLHKTCRFLYRLPNVSNENVTASCMAVLPSS